MFLQPIQSLIFRFKVVEQGCEDLDQLLHELLHVLGFIHEQSRPDRNRYVEILWNNIDDEKKGNFRRFAETNNVLTPYDFERRVFSKLRGSQSRNNFFSILHYPDSMFAKYPNQPTMRARYEGHDRMGNDQLSVFDQIKINRLYKCGAGKCSDKLGEQWCLREGLGCIKI